MKNPKRNYGFGRSLKYAAKNVLSEYLGDRFSTIASHCHRFNLFADFCKKYNTNNSVFITQDLFENYAFLIQKRVFVGDLSTHYGHNLISSVNVVMHAFRRDKKIWFSPKKLFGPRCHIRKVAPNMSLGDVKSACKKINAEADTNIALLIWLARILGLRLREAILIDAKKALKQARKNGFVDIRRGTKGGRGRKVERLIGSNKRIVFALELAVISQEKRKSFIPDDEKLITFYRRIHKVALPILKEFNINKIHDLRAAFACDEYKYEFGVDAPVISGETIKKTQEVKEKLKIISKKLGHNREYIIDSYCGS
ncbi:MAG: hypothetical protein ACI9LM_004409 [Alteromonadaceae bacterium]|jgi:hypothetical protein